MCAFSLMMKSMRLNSLDETSRFDILRLDMTWLSWFAQKLLRPLSEIDEDIENSLGQYVEGVPELLPVNDQIYALPVTPSAQILYYRKDLFGKSYLQADLF